MKREDIAKLLLRLVVGGLMLFHGVSKVRHGIGGITSAAAGHGLPAFIAYGVYIGEVLAPIAVLIGFFTRCAAAVVAFNMIVAVGLAHAHDLFHLGKGGGYALELQALYFIGAVAIALLGPGRYAVRGG
jgi:putative oxidoreductase